MPRAPFSLRFISLAISFALTSLTSIYSQEIPSAATNKADSENSKNSLYDGLESIRSHFGFPGMACGRITKNGALTLEVCGVAKQGETTRLKKNSLMHLGSCTKSMTATLVAIYVEEGKLRWDSSLKSIFEDLPELKKSPWGDITVNELLEHTSGLPANAAWSKWSKATDRVKARHEIAAWVANLPWDDKRHGAFDYSNVGYMLLGHAIEQLEKRSWEEIISERLFRPLSMKSAGFGSPVSREDYPVTWGHIRSEDGESWMPIDLDNPAVLGPAGTAHASMEDWCKYLRVHLMSPNDPEFPLPIGNENWKRLHQSQLKTEYAGGWGTGTRDWANGSILTHNGSNTMWYCVVFLAPERGLGVFAAANVGLEASPVCDRALQLVLRDAGLLENKR